MTKMTSRRKKPKKTSIWLYRIIFIIGLLSLFYPLISHVYYSIRAEQEISRFETGKKRVPEAEMAERFALAQAYNSSLDPSKMSDPYTDEEKRGRAAYAQMLEVEEQLGYVEIPAIKTKLPVYAGTSDSILQRGVGHLEGTSLPIGGESNHTVLTAHRGLPEANLFTDLDKMEIGDVFYVHNIFETLAYEVDQIVVVEPSDFSQVQVELGQDYATLLTCTPYAINSHRLLVRGHRIPYDGSSTLTEKRGFFWGRRFIEYVLLVSAPLLALILWLIYRKRKKKDV